MRDERKAMVEMYHRVCRPPKEGTASAAIVVHAQACGFVAYAFDVHPNRVAQEVAAASPIPQYPNPRGADW